MQAIKVKKKAVNEALNIKLKEFAKYYNNNRKGDSIQTLRVLGRSVK